MKIVGIVAFAFGVPSTIHPNRRIAKIASKKAQEFNGMVYTQLDIRVDEGIRVEYIEQKPGNPPTTLRIARGAVLWAHTHGLTELWVVAAKPHLWRALRDLQRTIREKGMRIEVRVCDEAKQYPENSWFCPNSTQDRVRSQKTWDKRERILKLIPFFVYKRLAS